MTSILPRVPAQWLVGIAANGRSSGSANRNRYKACQELGIEMDFCEIEDKEDFDPIAYVLSHNLHRRHLTTSQRSDVAGKVATMRAGDNQHSKEVVSKDTTSINEAAAQMKVSPASVKRAKKVHSKGSESTKKALADGSLPVTTAAAFVDAVPDKEEQEASPSLDYFTA